MGCEAANNQGKVVCRGKSEICDSDGIRLCLSCRLCFLYFVMALSRSLYSLLVHHHSTHVLTQYLIFLYPHGQPIKRKKSRE